jgi:amino acid transporter
LGVCSGINLVLSMGLGIPYEIISFNLILNFWTDKIPVAAVVVFIIVLYACVHRLSFYCFSDSRLY